MIAIELSPREVALVHAWLRIYRGDPWTWCPLEVAHWPVGDPMFDELLWTIAGSAANRGDECAPALLRRLETALGPDRVEALYWQKVSLVGAGIKATVEEVGSAGLQRRVESDLADRDARHAAAERDGFAVRADRSSGRPQ